MREWLRRDIARLRQRRWIHWLEQVWIVRLTPFGRALCVVGFAAALLGQDLGLPIFLLWAFITATFVCAEGAARVSLPLLEVRVLPIVPTSAGSSAVVELAVKNPGRRLANRLTIQARNLPSTLRRVSEEHVVDVLGPGETTRASIQLIATRRGVFELSELRPASSFPLGLVRCMRGASAEARLLVYPRFLTPISFSVPQGRNYQPGGLLLSSQVGESAELMHTREYRVGDNPRHVHWPSTARFGAPVVKVYHEEFFARLALLIDTEVATGAGDVAFEAGISTAAGIADYLSQREYIIDLFAVGGRVYHFQAGRALANFDSILEILACVESSPTVDWEAVSAAIVPQAARLTGVVAILMDWNAPRRELIEGLLARGVGVRVLLARSAATSEPEPGYPADVYDRIPLSPPAAGPWP